MLDGFADLLKSDSEDDDKTPPHVLVCTGFENLLADDDVEPNINHVDLPPTFFLMSKRRRAPRLYRTLA
jgi:hypothetical protein